MWLLMTMENLGELQQLLLYAAYRLEFLQEES